MSITKSDPKVAPYYSLEAGRTPPGDHFKDRESLGSILMHSNGSVTVSSIRGPLEVRSQAGVLLASLSSGDSITLPAVKSGLPQIAQRDVATLGGVSEIGAWEFLGLPAWAWVAIGVTAIGVGTVIAVEAAEDDDDEGPLCP